MLTLRVAQVRLDVRLAGSVGAHAEGGDPVVKPAPVLGGPHGGHQTDVGAEAHGGQRLPPLPDESVDLWQVTRPGPVHVRPFRSGQPVT